MSVQNIGAQTGVKNLNHFLRHLNTILRYRYFQPGALICQGVMPKHR
ncbi:hypothetical protein OKW46_004861 [Paraburkholderia sp. WSM4179]|nr:MULTISPECIES: hypothetical protein [Paraburkholderia]MDH6150936.1 hypothetical protein [Paraburkholderia sp. WSM4179]